MTTNLSRPELQLPENFDPTDAGICEVAIPHEEFAALRATSPVFWIDQQPEAYAGFENTPGYWAVTKHADQAGGHFRLQPAHDTGFIALAMLFQMRQ